MSAPLAKGLIIAASIVVAAGIAIYENEQLRQWIEEHRRKIALAFYSMGDGINPGEMEMRSPDQKAQMEERQRQRRLDIVRMNKEELLRKAREQGIAVDLDELGALNLEEMECAAPVAPMPERQRSATSFDELIGEDGKLKREAETAAVSTFSPVEQDGLRHRIAGSRGFATGASFANPFDDEAHVLLDHEEPTYRDSEPPVRNMTPRPISPSIMDSPVPYINIPVTEATPFETPVESQFKDDDELEAEIQEAIKRSLEEIPDVASPPPAPLIDIASPATTTTIDFEPPRSDSSVSLANSLYDPPSPRLEPYASTTLPMSEYHSIASSINSLGSTQPVEIPDDGEQTPSGVLTPTEDGFSTISSTAGRAAPDIAVLADLDVPTIDDARSEATADSFSVVGASTPGSWSDVDSESETEAQNGESLVRERR